MQVSAICEHYLNSNLHPVDWRGEGGEYRERAVNCTIVQA